MCDIKAADKAVVKTFENVFSNLVSKRSNEDDIRALLTKKAVNACRSTILHKNKKAFNIPIGKNFAGTVYDPKKILTDGDACDQIVANLPPLHRFIYVLHTVAELSNQKNAEFLNISLENVSDALNAEEANVNRIALCISQKTSEPTAISVDMLAQLMTAKNTILTMSLTQAMNITQTLRLRVTVRLPFCLIPSRHHRALQTSFILRKANFMTA